MDKEKGDLWGWVGWREWVIVASALIVAIGVAAILSPLFRGFIADPATAAWVQALGSVGAILAAVWIAQRQVRESERRMEAQSRRALLARQQQEQEALRLIHAEIDAFAIKRLASIQELITDLEDARWLPEIPLAALQLESYRRTTFLISRINDASLAQFTQDIFADISLFAENLKTYSQLREECKEAQKMNDGQYMASTYHAQKNAEDRVLKQAKLLVEGYKELALGIDALKTALIDAQAIP